MNALLKHQKKGTGYHAALYARAHARKNCLQLGSLLSSFHSLPFFQNATLNGIIQIHTILPRNAL